MQVGQIGEDRGSPKTAAAFLLHSNEGGRQVCGRVASSVGNLLDCIFLYLCVCVFLYLCGLCICVWPRCATCWQFIRIFFTFHHQPFESKFKDSIF